MKLRILIAALVMSSCAMGDDTAAPTDPNDAAVSESAAAEVAPDTVDVAPDTVDVDDAGTDAAALVATKPSCMSYPVGHSAYDRETGITDSWWTCY